MSKQRYNDNLRPHDPFSVQEGMLGKVGKSYKLSWAEETYMEDGKPKEAIRKNFEFRRLLMFNTAVVMLFMLLAGRTAWLQIVKGDYYYSMAEGNRIRVEKIEAKRGVIYDREMKPLVRNVANFMIYMIPADLPKDDAERTAIIKRICDITGKITPAEIDEIIGRINPRTLEAYSPVFILDNIEYEKAMLLYIESEKWSGVFLSSKTRREYDLGAQSLSHVIGYTGKINEEELRNYGEEYLPIDYVGKSGVEYFWENHLKGENGKKQIEVDALGKEKKIIGEQKGEDGRNLALSIDVQSQKKLEDLIRTRLAELKLTRASAVLMDPDSGEILALISLPAYDSNLFAKGISAKEYETLIGAKDKPLFFRAISGEFPSGSTIKPVILAAALQEKVVSENTTILSTGGLRIGQWFFPDWNPGGHGRTSAISAIADSVNTYFYYIGGGYEDFTGLGIDRIEKYMRLFNLGAQTGNDLPGEAAGFVPDKKWKEETKNESWYIGDTYHLAIGQGDLSVTPLQVAAYTALFANGGELYRPHIVRQILSSKDQVIASVREEPIRENFIDSYNVRVVREGMRMTVTGGSARSLGTVGVDVAGKTGTAQWSTKNQPHAWFTGFAPYENPEVVITILIEEGGEGSSVAVPIAREFLTWYFNGKKDAVVATSTMQ